ncbi:MAG: GtrA family protein [Patescibacteria group bacterium]|jgi:putative flippase GtrA
MKDIIRAAVKKYRKFLLYTAIGLTGVSLNYALFYVFVKVLDMHYQLANLISVSVGITNNFIWNAKLNFKVSDALRSRFIKFYSVGLCGYILSSLLLYVFHEKLGIEVLVSKLMTMFFVLVLQYSLNSKYSFGNKTDD